MKQFCTDYFKIVVIVCLLGCLNACGYLHKKNIPSKEALEKRISTYWELLIKDDLEKAFKFIEPNAQKMQNRMRFCSGMGKFIFLSYEIEDITIKGDHALARVKRTFKIRPGLIPVELDPINQTLADSWVYVNGLWYIAYKKPKPPLVDNSGRPENPPSKSLSR